MANICREVFWDYNLLVFVEKIHRAEFRCAFPLKSPK